MGLISVNTNHQRRVYARSVIFIDGGPLGVGYSVRTSTRVITAAPRATSWLSLSYLGPASRSAEIQPRIQMTASTWSITSKPEALAPLHTPKP